MAQLESQDFQLYFSRIRPIYHQLFNIAHAITGNCDQAEYALQYAMLESWAAGDHHVGRHGFRESLRSGVIRAALKSRAGDHDWPGLQVPQESSDPILSSIAQENAEIQRMLTLRYGCGLSAARIARIMDAETDRVRTLLHRFEARTRRKLTASERRRYDQHITRALRSLLSQSSGASPDMSAVFRTFQADAADVSRPSRLPMRIFRAIFITLLALFCIAAFWFISVLMQPAVLETPQVQTEIVQEA